VLGICDPLGQVLTPTYPVLSPHRIIRCDLGLVKSPLERCHIVLEFLRRFFLHTTYPVGRWQCLLGHLTLLEELVPLGMVRLQPIQAQLLSHWSPFRGNRIKPVTVTAVVRLCIQWWCLEEHVMGVGCRSDGPSRSWTICPTLHYKVGRPIWRARRARGSGRLRRAHNTFMCWNWKRSVWTCATSESPFGDRRFSSPRTMRLW